MEKFNNADMISISIRIKSVLRINYQFLRRTDFYIQPAESAVRQPVCKSLKAFGEVFIESYIDDV